MRTLTSGNKESPFPFLKRSCEDIFYITLQQQIQHLSNLPQLTVPIVDDFQQEIASKKGMELQGHCTDLPNALYG